MGGRLARHAAPGRPDRLEASVAVILVGASILGFVRDRRSGVPVGLSIVSIVIGAALALGHAGLMIPGALT